MNNLFTSTDIMKTFHLEDVTDDAEKVKITFGLVSESYAKLSSQPIDPEEVYQQLCQDEYRQLGLARILLLTGYNPASAQVEALGTLRIVFGGPNPVDGAMLPLEAMELMHPPAGWAHFNFADFAPERAFEYSRFVVSPRCRVGKARPLNLHVLVMKSLMIGAAQLAAQRYGKDQAWAIAPFYVAQNVISAGFSLTPAPAMSLNYAAHASLFEKYDRYWLHGKPEFYRIRLH